MSEASLSGSSVSLPPLEAISISPRPLSPLHVLTTPAHEPLNVPTGMLSFDNKDSTSASISTTSLQRGRGRGRGRRRGGGRGSVSSRSRNGDRFRGIVRLDPQEPTSTSEEIADELGSFFDNVEIKVACVQSVCPSISITRIRDRLLRTNGDVSAAISYFTESSHSPHPSHIIHLDAPTTTSHVTSPDVLEIDSDVDVEVDVDADDTNMKVKDDEKHHKDEKHNKRKQTDENSMEQQSHIKRKKKKNTISQQNVLKSEMESHDIDVVVIDDDDD